MTIHIETRKKRVLVVDDSSFFRKRIVRLLSTSGQFEFETAENGQDALDKIPTFKPDLITMDVVMPVMDGIEAVRRIMAESPIPILMFSALTHEGAQSTLDALEAGAMDFLPKQWNQISKDATEVESIIFRRVTCLAQARFPTVPIAAITSTQHAGVEPVVGASVLPVIADHNELTDTDLIVIGSSTGGPKALEDILCQLDNTFAVPVVIAQHMPKAFTRAFALRLRDKTGLEISEACDGAPLLPGSVYVLPGGKQVSFEQGGDCQVVRLHEPEESDNFAPSVDTTLKAAHASFGSRVMGIILTGMGRDGCRGAGLLKQSNSHVWVQDRDSSVVWGMPGAVAESGLADRIMAPKLIGSLLSALNIQLSRKYVGSK